MMKPVLLVGAAGRVWTAALLALGLWTASTIAVAWLERDDKPLPRRLAVTFVNAPGEPEYLTVIKAWQLDGSLDAKLFRFEPPTDWRRIGVLKIPPLSNP